MTVWARVSHGVTVSLLYIYITMQADSYKQYLNDFFFHFMTSLYIKKLITCFYFLPPSAYIHEETTWFNPLSCVLIYIATSEIFYCIFIASLWIICMYFYFFLEGTFWADGQPLPWAAIPVPSHRHQQVLGKLSSSFLSQKVKCKALSKCLK